jgi:hypothetical protein
LKSAELKLNRLFVSSPAKTAAPDNFRGRKVYSSRINLAVNGEEKNSRPEYCQRLFDRSMVPKVCAERRDKHSMVFYGFQVRKGAVVIKLSQIVG